MSFTAFQLACVGVLTLAYAVVLAPREGRRERALTLVCVALTAWVGEQSCISAYRAYAYADGWWLKLGDVPLLIPLIWPMVVLSAREVVMVLWPGLTRRQRAAAVGLLVFIDASLMEIIAVSAGLWSWTLPNYFDVPLIGIIGWGFFGVAASWWLDGERPLRQRLLLLPVFTIGVTHALLIATWWGALRWVLRDPWPPEAVYGFAALCVAIAIGVARSRAAGHAMPWATAGPRIIASSLFFVLLATLDQPSTPWLWLHTAAVAVPYLLATRWRFPAKDAPPT